MCILYNTVRNNQKMTYVEYIFLNLQRITTDFIMSVVCAACMGKNFPLLFHVSRFSAASGQSFKKDEFCRFQFWVVGHTPWSSWPTTRLAADMAAQSHLNLTYTWSWIYRLSKFRPWFKKIRNFKAIKYNPQ